MILLRKNILSIFYDKKEETRSLKLLVDLKKLKQLKKGEKKTIK